MNADELFIRCPTCKTVFRTQADPLSLQSGRVRCGECRMVFDGRANLVDVGFEEDDHDAREEAAVREALDVADRSLVGTPQQSRPSAPVPAASTQQRIAGTEPDEDVGAAGNVGATTGPGIPRAPFPAIAIDSPVITMGPATVSRGPSTMSGAGPVAQGPSTIAGPASVTIPATTSAPPAAILPAAPAAPAVRVARDTATIDYAATPLPYTTSGSPDRKSPQLVDTRDKADHVVMPDWKGPTPPPRGAARWGYGLLALLLLVGLAAQSVFHFRNAIAGDFPATRPHLAAACAVLRCKIEPLRDRDDIVIDSHDLQADPAHQGLLIFQATLRNQARHPLAFPHLELELDDEAAKPIVRRVFAPVDYAGGAADFSRGIPPNSEWNVKLFLDGSSISAGSYHLYHFYP